MREVRIHIGEVVVEGVDLADPRAFQAALEATLTRLALTHTGDFPSGAVPVLHGGCVTPSTSGSLGRDVAHSVWSSMIPTERGGRL